jgi:hypothetical protein
MIFNKIFRPLFDGTEGGGGGTAVLPDWVTQIIPEDARKDPELAPLFNPDQNGNPPDMAKYKNPVEFIKTYKNQLKAIGQKGVLIPADFDKASPEELERYYNGIGRPAKPEEYKFSELKDLHPSLKIDEKAGEGFKKFLWEKGVPARQADAFNQYATRYLSDMIKAGEVATQKQIQAHVEELKKEWGDHYSEKVAGATKLVKAILGDKAADLGPLESTPAGLRFLAKISEVISEDSIAKITAGGGGMLPEQEQALKEIEEVKTDGAGARKHPLNDEKHPDHKKWIGTDGLWTKLFEKAYSSKA